MRHTLTLSSSEALRLHALLTDDREHAIKHADMLDSERRAPSAAESLRASGSFCANLVDRLTPIITSLRKDA